MFSHLKRDEFSIKKGASFDNLLDIAKRAGVNVVWIDNNSNSKGVANRIENLKNIRGSCEGECQDEKMLEELPKYIKDTKDTIIVLHQMGNHGPAYYKRYPKEFEKFKPNCDTKFQTSQRKVGVQKEARINSKRNFLLDQLFPLASLINQELNFLVLKKLIRKVP